jgi:acrylyl-CoA reductase (NADPH)
MAIGTPGCTAMQSDLALEHGGLTPERGDMLVTGANGGAGSVAIAIDAVGSHTLANVRAQTQYRGAVAAFGLAQGADLPGSVLPFILRNVTLAGIDSVNTPRDIRLHAWSRLTNDLDLKKPGRATQVIGLGEVVGIADRVLAGKVQGRTVVDVNT